MDGVAVGEDDALGDDVTGAPQGVGVVPLLGLVVLDEGELDAVAPLQGGPALDDGFLAVADDDGGVGEADLGEVGRVRSRTDLASSVPGATTGTRALGRVSV